MILLVDAGNTRIKWALAEPGAPLGAYLAQGALAHAERDRLAGHWQAALAGRRLERALLSNVAGPDMAQHLRAALPPALAHTGLRWFASLPQLAGLRNGYRTPDQLGCDRFAAAIGARALAPGCAVIVANCGTATTIDAVSADAIFIGGMILPGLGLMASALARNTAQLPQVATPAAPPPLFADNTADAITSGCLSAQAGAIERAWRSHGAVECLVSGGAAAPVAAALAIPHRIVDNIVLIGLHAAAGSTTLD